MIGRLTIPPRLIAILCAVGAILGVGWYVAHLRDEARQARSERDAAVASSTMRQAETKTIVQYHEKETVIREIAAPALQQIQEAPGGETLVPDPVLDGWRAGLIGLRNSAAAPADLHPVAVE